MDYFEELKNNIERIRSFNKIKNTTTDAQKIQTKLDRAVKKYNKFTSKNISFLTQLHNLYYGMYDYYMCYYENDLIYRGKYMHSGEYLTPEIAKKFLLLDKLIRGAYYENSYFSRQDAQPHNETPATDKLNEFLTTERNSDFNKYCENKNMMLRNNKYLAPNYFTFEQLLVFDKKSQVLKEIFDNIINLSTKLNSLNNKINEQSLNHIAKYDRKSYYECKKHLIPSFNHNLERNIDYISLVGILDKQLIRDKAIEHAIDLKTHLESESISNMQ